ncbi:curli-like amyloid fiber formation chaperone CsgH [Pollutimonas bauzanensis]|jgi:curli production protein|uniref:curli-like amyloid fiber formation chaperone CsgH n=1 Tax=Pollutimonas bauzanensis TaxID=658167 RepID=UPI003340067C
MTADSDIQVWLETYAKTQPVVIVPYVKSSENVTLRYKVRTVKEGSGGKSVMGQGGVVSVSANVPAALSRMSLSRSPTDVCHIDLVLSESGVADRNYHFDCPR